MPEVQPIEKIVDTYRRDLDNLASAATAVNSKLYLSLYDRVKEASGASPLPDWSLLKTNRDLRDELEKKIRASYAIGGDERNPLNELSEGLGRINNTSISGAVAGLLFSPQYIDEVVKALTSDSPGTDLNKSMIIGMENITKPLLAQFGSGPELSRVLFPDRKDDLVDYLITKYNLKEGIADRSLDKDKLYDYATRSETIRDLVLGRLQEEKIKDEIRNRSPPSRILGPDAQPARR